VLKLVKDGTLATLLPSAVLREHRGLVTLPVTPALPQRTVALLTRRRASTTLAANAFSAVLFELISQQRLGET
jgi:LysR family transcriptional regulator, cyn operon transcriptional activator